MKKIKRILTVLIIITMLSLSVSLISFAEESNEPGGVVNGGEPATNGEEGENSASEDTSITDTVIGIVTAAVGEDFMSIAGVVLNVVLLVILALMKRTVNTSTKDIVKIFKNTNTTVKEKYEELRRLSENESSTLEAFKSEIKAELDATLQKMLEGITERFNIPAVSHEQLAEIVEIEKAQLDMIDTIYQHSSTVPTSTKEKLTHIHTEALKKAAHLEEEDSGK